MVIAIIMYINAWYVKTPEMHVYVNMLPTD